MNKKIIFLLMPILIVILIINIPGNQQDNKVDNRIIEKLKTNENVDVIVKFEEKKSRGIFGLNSKDKETIEKELTNSFNVTYTAKTINSVSVSIKKKDIDKLNNLDYVKEIKIAPKINLLLQDSTGIVNASKTWPLQISGINLTGIGETICIIDSGINYSHSALGNCTTSQFLAGNCSKVIGGYAFFNNISSNQSDVRGDSDHGTHVAGIAAANGSIIGVAPGAKIVALKACGPTSACDYNAVIDSLNWCVNNASKYNISVISLSLGSDVLYSSYCDSDYADATTIINNAIARNISVTASTGNAGSTTGIGWPSCTENATSVGGVDKSDSVTYNRNNITELLAPGTNINSTILNGNYGQYSGTSMSTPHVSGAFAILNQFLKLQNNRSGTPTEMQNALNNTGKRISDSSSGLNFSRINILSAIISLDSIVPNVTLISPANNLLNPSQNQTFRCNATDFIQLKNITLRMWNSTSLYYENATAVSGTFSQAEWNLSNLPFENYKWNCLAYDTNNNFAQASSNFSLITNNLSVILSSPANNTFTNSANWNFTCNATTSSSTILSNITFYLWNSTTTAYSELKNMSGIINSTIFNYSFSNEISYKWNCFAFNNQSNSVFASSNFTITYDITSPIINLISPVNNTLNTTTNTIDFLYNITDTNSISNCSLVINNQINKTTSNPTKDITNNITTYLPNGNYNWSINCTDAANNQNSSETRNLSINYQQPQQEQQISSSGAGGISSKTLGITYTLTEEQIKGGIAKILENEDIIKFNLFYNNKQEQHTIHIKNITSNSVTLLINSAPITAILFIGETKKFDLIDDGYYDLQITLNSIINLKANLTIKQINESYKVLIPIETTKNQTANKTEAPIKTESRDKKNFLEKYIILIITIFILVVLLVYIIKKIKELGRIKQLKKKTKNPKTKQKIIE